MGRDAIHVAIAPVTAAHELSPGNSVGRFPDGSFGRTADKDLLGVVDPYLNVNVMSGERFYLFLYPNSVTSLRHVWTHPAFKVNVPKEVSDETRG